LQQTPSLVQMALMSLQSLFVIVVVQPPPKGARQRVTGTPFSMRKLHCAPPVHLGPPPHVQVPLVQASATVPAALQLKPQPLQLLISLSGSTQKVWPAGTGWCGLQHAVCLVRLSSG
jgi:hypothetical protein